ncbi:hypothetical protein ACPBEH_02585 [Latilactobacillus sp. 5-91]|uniref:hypothetical protein n=1 Tax=Latilactobacillus sp. 5-91 TaxID=3410924 RepID=UPI003C77B4F5
MSYPKLSAKAKTLLKYPEVKRAMRNLQKSKAIEERACLDDYNSQPDQLTGAIAGLNMHYNDLHFKLEKVLGVYGIDLVITNNRRKAEYDKIPKTHTQAEVDEYLAKEYGINKICCLSARNEWLTEDEFQEQIKVGKIMQDIFDKTFEKKRGIQND